MHEWRAKFRVERNGHVVAAVAIAIAIAGIIVILGAFSLRADNELLQYRIFIVHGPDQFAQARAARRNMNATHALVLSERKDRTLFIFVRYCVDNVKFLWVVDDERVGW